MNYRYKLETLSPLHVGSGADISPIEYIIEEDAFCRVDMDRLFKDSRFDNRHFIKLCGKTKVVMEEFDKKTASSHPIYRLDLDRETKRELLKSLHFRSGDIKEHVKIADKPYLPGSSIKGALRTALASVMLERDPKIRRKALQGIRRMLSDRKRDRKRPDKEVNEVVFGKDPHHDILRSLHISDTELIEIENLHISMAKVLTTTSPSTHGWKQFPRRAGSLDRATPIFLEALKRGVVLEGVLKIDKSLLYGGGGSIPSELGFTEKQGFIEDFASISREHALSIIDYEIGFYGRYNTPRELDTIKGWYRGLREDIEKMDENDFPLQLGWGAGWRSMTVSRFLEQEGVASEIRKKFKLGKPHIEFPKTRRLLLVDGKPTFPLGWVKLTISDSL